MIRRVLAVLAGWAWFAALGALTAWSVYVWFGGEAVIALLGAWCGTLQWVMERRAKTGQFRHAPEWADVLGRIPR